MKKAELIEKKKHGRTLYIELSGNGYYVWINKEFKSYVHEK